MSPNHSLQADRQAAAELYIRFQRCGLTMTDPNRQADVIAEEKARRIVGRVALKKMSALVISWNEEEKAARRFIWWVLFGLGFCMHFVC